MFCPKCGNQIDGGIKFCPKCGSQITGATQSNWQNAPAPQNQQSAKSGHSQAVPVAEPNRKRINIIFPMLIPLVIIGAAIAFLLYYMLDYRYVLSVKDGYPESYKNITYEEAFESFFANPQWEYFVSTEKEDIVEFTGECIYQDKDATVKIQFTLDYDNGTFKTTAMSINGKAQNELMLRLLIAEVFESYKNGNDDNSLDLNKETAINEADSASGNNGEITGSNNYTGTMENEQDYMDDPEGPAETQADLAGFMYSEWLGSYTRDSGPYSTFTIFRIDENEVVFSANIGAFGNQAFRKLDECTAFWIDDAAAVYNNPDGSSIEIYFHEEGLLSVNEAGIDKSTTADLTGVYGNSTGANLSELQYVLYSSDSVYYTRDNLTNLGAVECKVARNEIYARHGRLFSDEQLQTYFDSCDWYTGSIPPEEFDVGILNDYEQKNAELISSYETEMGYR